MNSQEKLNFAYEIRKNKRLDSIDPYIFSHMPVEEKEIDLNLNNQMIKIFITEPKYIENTGVIINLHGGGFVKGRLDYDKLFCYELAQTLNVKVISLDYKLAPEFTYPTQINECYELVKWVYNNHHELNVDKGKIALMGHSAGGNLVTATTIKLIEEGLSMVNQLILDYPALALHIMPENKKKFHKDLPYELVHAFNKCYCEKEELSDYKVSPLLASGHILRQFPKTLIITAGQDMLAEEAKKFHDRLIENHVFSKYQSFKHSHHGFTVDRRKEYTSAFELICSFFEY